MDIPPHHAALLDRALAVGAALIERLLDLPTQPDPECPRNPATDYNKLTYSMRQTILLLHGDADARETRRTAARKQIFRAVEDAIHLHAAPRADRLVAELRERLDDPAFDAEITTRPTPDLVAELCRDLHALPKFEAHAHQRRTPDLVAALTARAAAPARTPLNPPPPAAPPQPEPDPPPPPKPAAPRDLPAPTATYPSPTRRPRGPTFPLTTPSLILPIRDD